MDRWWGLDKGSDTPDPLRREGVSHPMSERPSEGRRSMKFKFYVEIRRRHRAGLLGRRPTASRSDPLLDRVLVLQEKGHADPDQQDQQQDQQEEQQPGRVVNSEIPPETTGQVYIAI